MLGYCLCIENYLTIDINCVQMFVDLETFVYKIWPQFWASKNPNNILGEHKYNYKYYWQNITVSYKVTMEIIVDPIVRQYYYPVKDICKHYDAKFAFKFVRVWTDISRNIKVLSLDQFIIKEKLPPLPDFITGYLVRDISHEQNRYPKGFLIESDYANGFIYKNFDKLELEKVTYYDLVMYGIPKSCSFIHEPLTTFFDANSVKLYSHDKHVDKYPEYMFLWKYTPVNLEDFKGKTKVLNSEIYLDSYEEKIDELIFPINKPWIYSDLSLQQLYPQFYEHTAMWNAFPLTSYEPYIYFNVPSQIEENSDFEKFWNDNKNLIDYNGSILQEYFRNFPKAYYPITNFSSQEFIYNNFFGINPLLNNLVNNYFVIEIRNNGWFLVYKINEPVVDHNFLLNIFLLYFDWLSIDYHDRIDTIYYGSDFLNNHTETSFLPQIEPGWRTYDDIVFRPRKIITTPDVIVDGKVKSYKAEVEKIRFPWVELIPEEIKANKALYRQYIYEQNKLRDRYTIWLAHLDELAKEANEVHQENREYTPIKVPPEAFRYKPKRIWHFFPHNAEWAAKYVPDDKEIFEGSVVEKESYVEQQEQQPRQQPQQQPQQQQPSKFEQSLYKLLNRNK